LKVFLNQFHHLRCVHMFLICWAGRCNHCDGLQPTSELSAPSPYNNPVSVHHHQTPTLTGSEFQGWKFFCLYKPYHTIKFPVWQFPLSLPLHINFPLNSMINWLLHHLLHVTSITVSTPYQKIKWLLKK
jgi:hypothetical protein